MHRFPSLHCVVRWTSARPKETLRSHQGHHGSPFGDVKTKALPGPHPRSLCISLCSDFPGSGKVCRTGQTCTFRKGLFYWGFGLGFLLWEVFTRTLDSLRIRSCLFPLKILSLFGSVPTLARMNVCAPEPHAGLGTGWPRGLLLGTVTSKLFEVAVVTATPTVQPR